MKQGIIDYIFKIDDYSIKSERISKTVLSDDEIPLIRVNIWIPQSGDESFADGREKFDSFFSELAKEFLHFAENDLSKKAKDIEKINHPYSAVMKFIPAYEDEEYISVIIDSFIYTERGRSKTKRMAFTFERQNGEIVISDDLLEKMNYSKKEICSKIGDKKIFKKINKALDKSDFYIVPNGIACFYETNDDNEVYILNKKWLNFKKLIYFS